MTAILFLSDEVTAFRRGAEEWSTGASVLGRKGRLRSSAGELIGTISSPGEVVASLPPSATSCQVLKVRARIGRQVTQNDISGALEAALGKAGSPSQAVVSAEPSEIRLDGALVAKSPVGRAAQVLDVQVTAFLSPLTFLAELERTCLEAGLKLTGVMAMEEAASASRKSVAAGDLTLLIVDRWHGKVVAFSGEPVRASALSPVGRGHVVSDLAVTFELPEPEAENRARQVLLGRVPVGDDDVRRVAEARLEELVSSLKDAASRAGVPGGEALLLGLPISPPVEAAFAAVGMSVRGPGLSFQKTEPPVMALAEGAAALAGGAAPRAAATALHLSTPQDKTSFLGWLRRNF